MDRGDADEAAMSARGWGIALMAVIVVCAIAAGLAAGDDWMPFTLTLAVFGAYTIVYVVFIRRASGGSRGAWVGAVVTVVAGGVLTALVPSNAVFQFWAFPALWTLVPAPRRALSLSFALAVTVFGGFLISTGTAGGALTTALLTEGISFGVAAAMGLWLSSIYAYGIERDRLLTELTAAQDELAALHRDAGTTTERERLARELHDTIAQSLTGAVLLVQRARRELADGRPNVEALALVEESVRAALQETRVLVTVNAQLELGGGGITAALGTLAERFRREVGIDVDVRVSLARPLDVETEVALLRCAQEGFGNIRKHSHARRVTVELIADDEHAVLTVRNDGRGFDPAVATLGYGLAGLRTRLNLVGGSLQIDGSEGAVQLRAVIPAGEPL